MRYLAQYLCVLVILLSTVADGQMMLQGETLFGHEWIDFDKTYHRVEIAEDGLYRINAEDLAEANVNLPTGQKWQLFFMGKEVPLYVSDETFGQDDYIIFYGQKNRNGLDSLLFPDKSQQLSPRYSLFTDTSSYFLTSTSDEVARLTEDAFSLTSSGDYLSYHMKRWHIDTLSTFQKKYLRSGTQKIYNSEFTNLTGWSSNQTSRYQFRDYLPDHYYTTEEKLTLGVRLAGSFFEFGTHLFLGIGINPVDLDSLEVNSLEVVSKSYEMDLKSNGLYNLVINRKEFNENPGFLVSNIWFEYPATFNLTDNYLRFKHAERDRTIHLSNLESNTDYFLVDCHNGAFGQFTSVNDSMELTLLQDQGESVVQKLLDIKSITSFEEIQLTQPNIPTDNGFVIVTSKKLYDENSATNYIDEYVEYRSSQEGGNYNVELLFVEELYDIYAYGIQRHPLSINNLSELIRLQNPDSKFMIIGKGRAFSLTRHAEELNAEENETFHVPSFGFPPADALLTSPIGEVGPRLAFGRLAVNSMEEVGIYLNNLKSFEQLAPTITSLDPNWQKRFIHLSGGNDLATTIGREFTTMSNTIQSSPLAPEIITFNKNGTTTVDSFSSSQIYDVINSGVSVVTFFGHAAPNTLGFRIDNEERYANAPLHPLFIALGCSAGNYNISSESVAEAYCLLENKGFLNLIASASISVVFDLSFAGNELYALIGQADETLDMGNLINLTIDKTLQKSRRQAGQLQLFGDPAVRLNFPSAIDFSIDESSVRTDPDILTGNLDSVTLSFDVLNHGLQPNENIPLKITQELPTGGLQVISETNIASNGYRTRVHVNIPVDAETMAGQNRILISLDEADLIEEILYDFSESNNDYVHSDEVKGYPVFIPSTSLTPLWPRDKSIVPNVNVDFYCSTGQLLSDSLKYLIEIDTTIEFNSSLLSQFTQQSRGGAIAFNPNYEFRAGQVYYWRASPDIDGENYFWSSHQSFIVLADKEGWNISHYYQFNETEKSGIYLDETRKWSFEQNQVPIRFGNGIFNSDDQDQIGWFEYNAPRPESTRLPWEAIEEALVVMAFDHFDYELINPRGGAYGSIPVNKDKEYFAFENTIAGRDSLLFFINNIIPDDFNVIFFTVRQGVEHGISTEGWDQDSIRNNGQNIFNTLEAFGAEKIRQFNQSEKVNYILRYSKISGVFNEQISFDDDVLLTDEFEVNDWETYGQLSLETDILEKSDREILEWRFNSDVDTFDTYNIFYRLPETNDDIYSVQNSLAGSLSFSNLPVNVRDSADFYADVFDNNTQNPVPAQAEFFRIYSELIGDYALAPNINWLLSKNSVIEGESVSFQVAVQNIHHNSLDVGYKVSFLNLNNNTLVHEIEDRLAILENEFEVIDITQALSQPGEYLIAIELNKEREFEEASYFNNTMQFEVLVLDDRNAPNITSTFDGHSIRNGQIISPTSLIQVKLKDENQFNLLNEEAFLDVRITQPDGSSFDLNTTDFRYIFPTIDTDNELVLEINGDFTQDGQYTLRATGRDKSNNQNQVDYSIHFQVFDKQGLGVKVFPNPVVDKLYIDYVLFNQLEKGQISCVVTNALGQALIDTDIPLIRGEHFVTIDIPSTWPAGEYFYQLLVRKEDGSLVEEYLDESLGFGEDGWKGAFILLRDE